MQTPFSFFRPGGLSAPSMALPVSLSLLATLFGLTFLSSLIHLSHGFVVGDFTFVRQLPGAAVLAPWFPGLLESSRSFFILLLIYCYVSVLLKSLFTYLSVFYLKKATLRASTRVRELIFSRYLSFGKAYFDRHGVGKLALTLNHCSSEMAEQVTAAHSALAHLFTLLAYIGMMLVISVPLTAFVAGLLLVLGIWPRYFVGTLKARSTQLVQSRKVLNQKIMETLLCVPLVKSSGTSGLEKDRFGQMTRKETELYLATTISTELVRPVENIVHVTALVLVAIAIYFLTQGSNGLRVANAFVFLYLVQSALNSFNAFLRTKFSRAKVQGGLEVLSDILDDREKFIVGGGTQPFTGLSGNIAIRDLSFSYSDARTTLSHLSLEIEKGKLTALVGASGAGKTTLASLLMRLYDCPPSSILLGGTDVRDFCVESLSTKMAYVSQESYFFSDTIRNNLTYGRHDEISEWDLNDVLVKCRLSDLVAQLPRGLDTPIGENGFIPSGGEKQRLALARALLRKPEFLILDEATSALDTETEAAIEKALSDDRHRRTTLIIAHRLSTIRNADKIVVLGEGRVQEEGSFDDLLARQGFFHRLWQCQDSQNLLNSV